MIVYRYRLITITITIKSVEHLVCVFVFWVDGYNNKQKRRETKSMCVCESVCVWSEGSCMIWYDIIINQDDVAVDDEEHSFNTRAAYAHTHTHTERTWVWPGHTPSLLYTQLDDPSSPPPQSVPRCPGVNTVKQKMLSYSLFIILYIYIYIFCLGLSFQVMYVCMYMLYMLYTLDYSLLYDICCLDNVKQTIRNVNWRWREWRNEEN